MNILYLCHRIPFPPDKGDKIRSYHQIKFLAQRHSIYLACLIDDPDDWQHVAPLQTICRRVEVVGRKGLQEWWRMGKAFLHGQPLSLGAFYVPALQEKVNVLLEQEAIDRIVIFSSPMAEYVKHVSVIPKIIDFVDMDSEKWRDYAKVKPFPLSRLYQLEADRLGQYELEMAHGCVQSLVISEEETFLLRNRSGETVVPTVIPNGVDYEFFAPDSAFVRAAPIIIFTAAMDYFPNVDAAMFFCEDIFPKICQTIPDAKIWIVGRSPGVSLRKLTDRMPQVEVTGTVPDVRPYLAKAMVAVAPLRIARGVQNKVLEAMAMALPVVGTTVAFQGLAVKAEHGIRLADDPIEFANKVIEFLESPSLARDDGLAARRFVSQYYDWSNVMEGFEAIIQREVGVST